MLFCPNTVKRHKGRCLVYKRLKNEKLLEEQRNTSIDNIENTSKLGLKMSEKSDDQNQAENDVEMNIDVDTHQGPVLLDSADIPCTLCDFKARTKKGISLHFRASHKNQMVNCSICPDFWTFDLSKYLKHCQTQKHKDKALTPGKKFVNVCHFDKLCKTEKMNKQTFINCLVLARNFI